MPEKSVPLYELISPTYVHQVLKTHKYQRHQAILLVVFCEWTKDELHKNTACFSLCYLPMRPHFTEINPLIDTIYIYFSYEVWVFHVWLYLFNDGLQEIGRYFFIFCARALVYGIDYRSHWNIGFVEYRLSV